MARCGVTLDVVWCDVMCNAIKERKSATQHTAKKHTSKKAEHEKSILSHGTPKQYVRLDVVELGGDGELGDGSELSGTAEDLALLDLADKRAPAPPAPPSPVGGRTLALGAGGAPVAAAVACGALTLCASVWGEGDLSL